MRTVQKQWLEKCRRWLRDNRQLDLLLFYIGIGIVHLLTGMAFPLGIGLTALLGTLVMLMLHSKYTLVLFELLPTFAILCLWFAPAASYWIQETYPDFWVVNVMPVDASYYFSIAIPSVLAICLGSQVPRIWSKKDDESIVNQVQLQLTKQPWLPVLLVGIGLIAYFVKPHLGMGWRQVGHYTSQLIWIGGMHALMSPRYKWINIVVLAGVLFMLVRDTLYSTMFGQLVFWLFFGMIYIQLVRQWAFWKLLVGGLVGLFLITILLTFKYNYRGMAEAAGGNVADRTALFLQALKNRLNDPWGDPWNLQQPLQRINQGYHLALTYHHVPAHEPFANGATIQTAFISALIPRIFWKDKPRAGGLTNYPRFTGVQLLPNVSTNISPAGDAYVNFGTWGAAVFLFFYALTLRLLFDGFRWLARHWYAPIWLWLPLIFFSATSIEKDVLSVWNDAVKGSVFIIIFIGALKFLDVLPISKKRKSKT